MLYFKNGKLMNMPYYFFMDLIIMTNACWNHQEYATTSSHEAFTTMVVNSFHEASKGDLPTLIVDESVTK